MQNGAADYGVVPVENSLYGRITDIYHLLPESGLFIIGEHFLRIEMNLLGVPGATLKDIKAVQSLSVALGQCRKFIRQAQAQDHQRRRYRRLGPRGRREGRQVGRRHRLALRRRGLRARRARREHRGRRAQHDALPRGLARQAEEPAAGQGKVKTTFVFRVRNVPAALYKAMGGFATNGVNMTKLESYMLDGSFTATQFYADIEGHPSDRSVQLAFEELQFFTDHFHVLGVYPAASRGDRRVLAQ